MVGGGGQNKRFPLINLRSTVHHAYKRFGMENVIPRRIHLPSTYEALLYVLKVLTFVLFL